jgi:hypothetical protein
VSKELGLDETASGTEDVLVGRRLNQGVREVLLETRCYIKKATYALTASEGDYDLQKAADPGLAYLAIDRFVDSNNRPLLRIERDELFELRRASATASSGQRRYALSGANMLHIWPAPGSAETLTVWYVPRPTEMTTSGHDPSDPTYGGIPAEYHEALEFYALWRLASYDDDISSNQGDRYFGQYQVWLAKIKKGMHRKGGPRMPKANLGRRPLLSSDPART